MAIIDGLVAIYILPTVIGIARQIDGLGLVICLNVIPVAWPAALLLACLMPRKEDQPHSSPAPATRAVADADVATLARKQRTARRVPRTTTWAWAAMSWRTIMRVAHTRSLITVLRLLDTSMECDEKHSNDAALAPRGTSQGSTALMISWRSSRCFSVNRITTCSPHS